MNGEKFVPMCRKIGRSVMNMYQAYKGQVCNGQLIISEEVTLPEDARLIITVVDDSPQTNTKAQQQKEALNRLYVGLNAIEDEPLDEKFDAIMNQRFNVGRMLDL
jgi:hypothetical protein